MNATARRNSSETKLVCAERKTEEVCKMWLTGGISGVFKGRASREEIYKYFFFCLETGTSYKYENVVHPRDHITLCRDRIES